MGTDTQITAEPEVLESDEQLVQQPGSAVTFVARRRDLLLIIEPREPIYGAGMKIVGQTPGKRVQFRNAHFIADREKDAEVIAELDKHRLNGNQAEGFWLAVEPAPEATPAEMQALVDAAIALDVERLEQFIAQEESGYAREDVLETARGALEKVRVVVARDAAPVERPPE